MEEQLRLLREIVSSVLPEKFKLMSVDVTVGTLSEDQEPSFKAVIRIVDADPAGPEPPGWGHELTERVRAFWSKDDLYIEVREEAAADQRGL